MALIVALWRPGVEAAPPVQPVSPAEVSTSAAQPDAAAAQQPAQIPAEGTTPAAEAPRGENRVNATFFAIHAGNYEVNYTVYLELCSGAVCFQMSGWAVYGEGPPGNYTYGVLSGRWPGLGDVVWEMRGATEGNESYGVLKMCIADLCYNETSKPVVVKMAMEEAAGACEAAVNGTTLRGALSKRTHVRDFLDLEAAANETACFYNGIPLAGEVHIREGEKRAYMRIEAVWLREFDEARYREVLETLK
ncbi:hypothetical protein Pogu_2129 [Pyrobaculum oguniense TE7]|uniref:Uncharacterized protein n=1 Tax=Pyrobaculum oguniense (strain DSM 13380 / JCM 10595 / TE7) TaxID=698757 RepID=H6QCW0_PYROT|nr:hypothetical protein Pogu_2129 [Pyrobaculum oguniense TE7]